MKEDLNKDAPVLAKYRINFLKLRQECKPRTHTTPKPTPKQHRHKSHDKQTDGHGESLKHRHTTYMYNQKHEEQIKVGQTQTTRQTDGRKR